MTFTTAKENDIAQITELRLAYINEDFGTLSETDAQKLRQHSYPRAGAFPGAAGVPVGRHGLPPPQR